MSYLYDHECNGKVCGDRKIAADVVTWEQMKGGEIIIIQTAYIMEQSHAIS